MRLDDLQSAGDAGFVAAPRLRHFLVGQHHGVARHLHLLLDDVELLDDDPQLELDLLTEIAGAEPLGTQPRCAAAACRAPRGPPSTSGIRTATPNVRVANELPRSAPTDP